MSDCQENNRSLSDKIDTTQRRHSDDPSKITYTEQNVVEPMPVAKKVRRFSLGDADEDGEIDEFDINDKRTSEKRVKLIDKSKFCDHGVQTNHFNTVDQILQSETSQTSEFCSSVDRAVIFDRYVEEILRNEEELFSDVKLRRKHSSVSNLKKLVPVQYQASEIQNLIRPLLVIERMIFHNRDQSLLVDFSCWDDPADEYRDTAIGTLLPIWKINCSKTIALCHDIKSLKLSAIARKQPMEFAEAISDMKWCPKYPDLLVLTVGNHSFTTRGVHGLVYGMSLKNLDVPEFLIPTKSGAMCLDIHKYYSNLICVGFYDGTVGVYDLSMVCAKNQGLKCLSNSAREHHIDPVTTVQWFYHDFKQPNPDDLANLDDNIVVYRKAIEFISTGEDGKIIIWKISRNGVGECHFIPSNINGWMEKKITVRISDDYSLQTEQPESVNKLDIRVDGQTYLVGTKSGTIYKLRINIELQTNRVPSKAIKFTSNQTDSAHMAMVTGLHWNPFYSDYFLSSSVDWTVKIWNYNEPNNCIIDLDLDSEVTDAKWSKHSSAVLGAVNRDLDVFVYDLSLMVDAPICKQRVLSSRRICQLYLTSILFNASNDSLTVADNLGGVKIFKMSPMLRRMPRERKKTSETQKNINTIVTDTLINVLGKFKL